ncbi:hypothetical protein CK203_052928 [Vitis vinifera]|uniref:Integrase catalytic domain-containing protein n=1 Tax=Vitis vinifera TaxID=29760 RepID=A0A438GT10_VITVI|nr:hypothetical protein CK203_052928 [Vitis vinifera]
MELTALALRSAAQKLRPYFQAHPVIVLTDQPLRNILHKPDLTGRMLQWAIELSEFGIEFQPRLSMKGQVMADFVLEYSRRPNQHHESSKQEWWTLRVDGASRSSGSGVGLLLQSPTGNIWSKPSGWDSLPLTMKQNMRPSCPDWTSPLLYPSPNSGYSDSQLVRFPPATPLRQTKQTIKNGRAILQNISGQALYPGDLKQAHKVRVQAAHFTLIGGTCTNGERSLAHRAHSQGYYWPTMKKDAAAYVKKYDKCQKYAPIPHMPSATLKSISGPWPFAQWGMDIVGPLPAAPAQKKFCSLPQIISVTDNGPQFDSIAFRNFCSELNIRNSYSTPRYPQSNGQAEATNKTLITALKKRLEQAKGKWVEELPGVLWAYRTTPGRPTGNTPFALAYGMDAVIPTEIGLPTIRTDAAKRMMQTELGRNLDWTDEVRESAAIRMADYQQRASAHYNRKVRPRSFKNGTLVLRKVFENTAEVGAGKFQANWEGPYIVSKASESGAYHLQNLVRSCLTSPAAGPSHPLPHAGGPPLIPPGFCLSQICPEGLILPRAVDKLASASSSLRRNWSSVSLREWRRPSYNQWSAAGQ